VLGKIIVEDARLGPLSIILDLDGNGKLLGIELLDVSRLVARPRFTEAETLGG
jgi:uncharacterized protein YuzE